MRTSALLLAALAKVVVSQDDSTWAAPGATDLRAPCPLLNSLANHGFLPHNGANISVADLLNAMDDALNLSDDARLFFTAQGNKALTASSTGNASTFHLTDLNTHDLIEHDGSLSRADIDQDGGDNWSFNATYFNETKSYWTTDKITLTQGAKALYARQKTQESVNPSYDLPLAQHSNALGQTAMYLGLFGDYSSGNARRDWVVYFFGKWTFSARTTSPDGNLCMRTPGYCLVIHLLTLTVSSWQRMNVCRTRWDGLGGPTVIRSQQWEFWA